MDKPIESNLGALIRSHCVFGIRQLLDVGWMKRKDA